MQTFDNKSVVFFDGYCNLCSSTVQFIFRHDKKKRILFCSLQSEKAKEIIKNINDLNKNFETVILFENNRIYTSSTAILRIVKKLNPVYPILFIFIIIPKPLREFVYRIIAKHRYYWFGKRTTCMIPTNEFKDRFID